MVCLVRLVCLVYGIDRGTGEIGGSGEMKKTVYLVRPVCLVYGIDRRTGEIGGSGETGEMDELA